MSGKDLFIRNCKTNFYIVIVTTVLLYLSRNFILSIFFSNIVHIQAIELFLWLGLIMFIWKLPRLKYGGDLKLRNDIKWWAFSAALVHVLVIFLLGFFDGLGKSPYDHSAVGVLLNILFIGGPILGREVVRSYLINHFKMRKNQIPLFVIGIAMGILGIGFRQVYNLQEYEEIFKYTSTYILPGISKSILATYLAYLAGPTPAIIYSGIIEGVHWLSPLLPNLEWIGEALIGTCLPMFSLLLIQNIYKKTTNKIHRNRHKEGEVGWALTSIISVAIVWFVVGVFPIYPSVIATGSMEPVIYPGDVIVIDKIQTEEDIQSLQIGDIVQFEKGDILISHRIVKYTDEDGQNGFYTKGDNNISEDQEIVKGEMIKGKIIKVIPKVGWPTLLLKDGNKDIPQEIKNGTKVVDIEQKR